MFDGVVAPHPGVLRICVAVLPDVTSLAANPASSNKDLQSPDVMMPLPWQVAWDTAGEQELYDRCLFGAYFGAVEVAAGR
jgi:hypothetical protein